MKRCSRCKLWKGAGDFTRNKSTLDGYSPYCTECRRIIRKEDYQRGGKERSAAKSRRNAYGISASQFALLKGRQKDACAICLDPLKLGKQTHLDHCHKTGEVRGILCSRCNTGLGVFQDDPERLSRAVVYLKQPRKVPRERTLFDAENLGGI